MKTPLAALAVIALAAMPNVNDLPVAEAQTAPASVRVDVPFAWDPVTENVDGTPITDLAGYIFSIAVDGVDLKDPAQSALKTVNVPTDGVVCTAAECRTAVVELLSGLPTDSYRVWLQAYDDAGNVSVHSDPTDPLNPDGTIPKAPVRFRFLIQLLIEGEIGG